MCAAAVLFSATGVRAESIERFTVDATLTSDRTLTLQETIDYDFGEDERRGIFRTLPERYKGLLLRHDLRYVVESITMDGAPVLWEKERKGADLVLRIGDPEGAVTGTHRYTIRYRTDRAITDVDGAQELYWNVTGHEWPVPIKRASFRFNGIPVERERCFTGSVGSTDVACSFERDAGSGTLVGSSPATLEPYEGFTVALRFPDGALRTDPLLIRWIDLLRDNFFTVLPLLLSLGMVGVWYVWGRDPRGRGVIVAQYEPPDALSPALMAGVVEGEISVKAMSSTLLDLARRGHARVECEGTNPEAPDRFFYTRLPVPTTDVPAPYERAFLEAVFSGGTRVDIGQSSTEEQWAAYQKAMKTLTDDMITRGWFLKNPGAIRGGWMALAFGIALLGFFLQSLPSIFLALVVGTLGWYMPKVTPLGAEVRERILGFKLFLSVTQKDRLAFTDAPNARPETFAEFLPYAVALGVEKEWADQFKGMLIEPPSYIGGAGTNWGSVVYVSALSQMSRSVGSNMTHRAKSGGSGFSGGSSGGGMGGGGGGSW